MLKLLDRQMNLKFLGFYSGSVDNVEGEKTKQAYKGFQKAYGLAVDGIYGKNTDAKLVQVIREIQVFLKVTVDGKAGQITAMATKTWQISQGLTADGIFGEKTRARMKDYINSWDCIQHFSKSEFNCKCCGKNNINLNVVKAAERIRNHFGGPVIVTCGTRCAKHNKEVGGVANSRHLDGKAIDLKMNGVSQSKLLNYAKTMKMNGVIRYTYAIKNSSAIHIDIE